jgi:hypothetical protein
MKLRGTSIMYADTEFNSGIARDAFNSIRFQEIINRESGLSDYCPQGTTLPQKVSHLQADEIFP